MLVSIPQPMRALTGHRSLGRMLLFSSRLRRNARESRKSSPGCMRCLDILLLRESLLKSFPVFTRTLVMATIISTPVLRDIFKAPGHLLLKIHAVMHIRRHDGPEVEYLARPGSQYAGKIGGGSYVEKNTVPFHN